MSHNYTHRWMVLVPNQVYLSIGSGNMTAADMQAFDSEFIDIIEASSAPLVHLVADSHDVLSLPSLTDMRNNRYPQHARMGYSLTTGAFHTPVMRFIMNVSSAVSQVRYKNFDTLAEACRYLMNKDASLPPIEAWSLPPTDNSRVS